MKKEIIWGLLVLALLNCQSAKAYDFAQDVLLYRITSDTTVEVVGIEFHGDSYPVRIPESVSQYGQTYQVTAIGDSAFLGKAVRFVTLPRSIRCIGRCAFAKTRSLRYVDIPDGLEQLSPLAFYDSRLCYVRLPGSLAAVGDSCFMGSTVNLLTICEGVKHIGKGAFKFCYTLNSIHFPKSIKEVEDEAFKECRMYWIRFDNSHVKIGNNVFDPIERDIHMIRGESWWNHVMVTDPDTAAVNAGAFASFNCPLYVPEGTADAYAKVEGWNVFGIKTMENRDYDARAIIEGSPDTWIVGVNGHSELNFCFTSVRTDNMDSPTTSHPTGWNSALTRPSEFFYGDNLKIQVRSDPEYFVDGIDINGEPVQFERVDDNLQTYEIEHLTHDVFIAIRACYKSERGYRYIRHDKVKYLITSPTTVAAANCDVDTKEAIIPETVEDDGQVYTVTAIADDAFYSKPFLTTVHLPSTLTKIGNRAFLGTCLSGIIEIPEGVDTIGLCAFQGGADVTKVIIPESSRLKFIGEDAFSLDDYTGDTEEFELITLPAGLQELKGNIFSKRRPPLAVLSYVETPPAIDEKVFTSPKTVIYVRQKDLASYQAAPVWKDLNLVGLPESEIVAMNMQKIAPSLSSPTIYDLQGRKVLPNKGRKPGVYIVNRRKVVFD